MGGQIFSVSKRLVFDIKATERALREKKQDAKKQERHQMHAAILSSYQVK
jgi:hypothetical protein